MDVLAMPYGACVDLKHMIKWMENHTLESKIIGALVAVGLVVPALILAAFFLITSWIGGLKTVLILGRFALDTVDALGSVPERGTPRSLALTILCPYRTNTHVGALLFRW
jgi:hypothetical protein